MRKSRPPDESKLRQCGEKNPLLQAKGSDAAPSKLLEPIGLGQWKKCIEHEVAAFPACPVGACEPDPHEMVRARHNFVMKLRTQEAFQPAEAICAALRGERTIHKIEPVAVHDGKIPQDLAGAKHERCAKLAGIKL